MIGPFLCGEPRRVSCCPNPVTPLRAHQMPATTLEPNFARCCLAKNTFAAQAPLSGRIACRRLVETHKLRFDLKFAVHRGHGQTALDVQIAQAQGRRMRTDEKQFSLNRGAPRKQIPISTSGTPMNQKLGEVSCGQRWEFWRECWIDSLRSEANDPPDG